jgi:BRCA1-associated protein
VSTTWASANGVTTNGTSSFYTSHAGQHYSETLHAYALDTHNQHVYDFAGQGYVHRLVQNKEDGKLVEINDPFSSSQERSMTPGLSDAQEGEVVHRKLEGFASQYYTLLKSQLEQQRTFYEQRLQEVRSEFAIKERNDAKAKADMLAVLRQEKKQLTHRLQTIQRKKEKALEDAKFLKSMNESMKANKPGLEQQIQQAQSERIASREMIQKYVPALEEKVTTLMLQLEESTKAS